MRHQKKKITLDRAAGPRKSMLANLAESIVFYEKIITTKAKAKAVKNVLERLITIAKKKDIASRRRLKQNLFTNNAVKKLIEEIGPRYAERNGGYTRIISLPNRKGDAAELALIELV